MSVNFAPAGFDEAWAVQDTERITCIEAECKGCDSVHRRAVGERRYYIEGERASKAAFEEYVEARAG